MNTIVLAGGKASAAFTAATGVGNRAMVELAPGKTMLDVVVRALQGAGEVAQIVIVGDVALSAPTDAAVEIRPPGESLLDNIFIGFDAVRARPDERVLLVSADIPFIDSATVDDFVRAALEAKADFCYPIVPMHDYRLQYSELKRTTLKLREGEFTGGNLVIARASVLTANPEAIRGAYAGRKSVARIGAMLGWGLLLRIAVSQIALPNLMNIALIETAVGRVLGVGVAVKAIVTSHASIGADIDSPEDVAIARKMLAEDAGAIAFEPHVGRHNPGD